MGDKEELRLIIREEEEGFYFFEGKKIKHIIKYMKAHAQSIEQRIVFS